jgi:signal transduction histidine kinase
LESLDVDGRRIYNEGGAIDGLMLAPDHLRLEFRFAALSFTSPGKVKFKYRLLGLDRDWVDSGNKRSASYSQLPPGSYQFECIACNDYGVWNTRGAGLAFTVMPFFWQTWWFLTLCGFAVFLFGAWAVRFEIHRRMQRQVAHLEQERAIERERTRIARDIHDDIGASLTRITLLSQWIPGGPGQESGATAVLQEISGTAREVTQSLDEIVWAVNPKHDTLESLVCYMAKFFQDFLGAAHVRCRLDLPAVVPDWSLSTHIRHNLFLAFKEVLNNAVKHSEASEVWLSLRIDPAAFVFAIGDNGRGMPTPCGPEGANGRPCGPEGANGRNGMSNLQHRLAQIGGRCEIVTRSGAGTTVTFVIGRPRSARRNSAKFPRNIAPGHEEHESFR